MDYEQLLSERQKTHGEFANVARLAQGLKTWVRSSPLHGQLLDTHAEAIDAILLKIARIIEGDSREPDHLNDIIGYARLALRAAKQASDVERQAAMMSDPLRPVKPGEWYERDVWPGDKHPNDFANEIRDALNQANDVDQNDVR